MKKNNSGFTMIELMIATSVFATAMVLILSGVIYISRQYQQSTNKVAINDATRIVHQQIAESLKYRTKGITSIVNGNLSATCIGNKMYVYATGPFVSAVPSDFDNLPPGLWIKDNTNNCVDTTQVNTSFAINLLPNSAKTTRFQITDTGNISTTFVRSPSDLIKLPTDPADAGKVECNFRVSYKEFCAATSLDSYATRRVN